MGVRVIAFSSCSLALGRLSTESGSVTESRLHGQTRQTSVRYNIHRLSIVSVGRSNVRRIDAYFSCGGDHSRGNTSGLCTPGRDPQVQERNRKLGVCRAQGCAWRMGETHRHEAQIYQLRAVLRGISPLIWRRLRVRSDSTVAQLHQALQVAFGWDDEHLNRFEIRGREYAVYRDGGGMIGIDARGARLDGLKLRRLERFLYEYDFGDSWIHDLRLEATLPIKPRKIYPICVAEKCSAPPEDCGGPCAFMANRQYYARFGRGRSAADREDFMDEFDDEEPDSFSDYDPDV